MKNPSRALLCALVLSLVCASSPLSAAAQLGRVAVRVPSAGVNGAAGAVRVGSSALLAPSGPALSAPSLGATPSLSPAPSVSLAPAAALGAAAPAAALTAPSAAPSAARFSLTAAPASALAAPVESPDRRAVIAGVESAVTELQGARRAGPVASPAALDRLFEGLGRREALSDAPSVAGSVSAPSARLAPASARVSAPANGPRWVFTGERKAQPKSSWKRTFSVGYLGAVAALVATAVIVIGAQLLGHVPHPNYSSPAEGLGATPSLLQAGVLFAAASVLAPVAEEILFRAGIQGGLSKVTKFLRLGTFWIPAVLGSLLFVAVHETADPVLFSARFVGAMLFAYIYQKEGMLASMAMHAFHNGLLTMPILAAAVVGSLGLPGASASLVSMAVILAGLAAVLLYGLKSVKLLRAQAADIRSGALAPKAFTTTHGVLALLVMLAGYFFLMPNVFWLAGAVGIMPWLLYQKLKN